MLYPLLEGVSIINSPEKSGFYLSFNSFKQFRLNFSLFLKDPFFQIISRIFLSLSSKKVSEYDQEIQQSDTANQPTAPIGRATEH